MKKIILLLFIAFPALSQAQKATKTQIIYEAKDVLVLNNGGRYEIILEQPFYHVNDPEIVHYKELDNQVTLKLNRILILRNKKGFKKLVEWSGNTIKYHELSHISGSQVKERFQNDLETITIN